jgi:serine/threonine protein kinase
MDQTGQARAFSEDGSSTAPGALSEVTIEQSGDRFGHYKLLQQIGSGGMGSVWMAEQVEPIRRQVAIKLIRAGMDSGPVLARFEAERQALALMDHPNIARVLDAGATPKGRPYFVMELVKGIPITRFCDDQRLSIRERLALFVPVCQAVQHAHQKGIIHRDLKPGNVLVALYDGKPVPKVIDFGVAKATGQRLTERTLFTGFGAIIGTLEYMSPEQAELNQLDIDTRSDIYSLGVLLYELLTGTTPLTRQGSRRGAFDEVLRRIREEEPPRPSTRLSQSKATLASISAQRRLEPAQLTRLLRGDLDWIVMKTLEKDRSRRYDTAATLATDIQRHLDDETVLARPPNNLYRFQRLVRRNRVAFAAAAAVSLALLAGLGLSTVSFLNERAARQRAVAAELAERRARRDSELAREKAQAEEKMARLEASLNRYAEKLFREAVNKVRDFSSSDPAKETFDFALVLHHFADLLRTRQTLPEARLLAEQATAAFRRHPDWPPSEQQHALQVLASILADLRDGESLAKLYPEALAAAVELRDKADPPAVSSLRRLARVFFDMGFRPEARTLYLQAVECYRDCAQAGDVIALNGLAWLLATCGDDAVRDGTRAVALAQEAVAMTKRQDPNSLDTLAAAYAEAGQFPAAASAEKEAIALLPTQAEKENFGQRLRIYEANRAFHE